MVRADRGAPHSRAPTPGPCTPGKHTLRWVGTQTPNAVHGVGPSRATPPQRFCVTSGVHGLRREEEEAGLHSVSTPHLGNPVCSHSTHKSQGVYTARACPVQLTFHQP